jgi:hypothetical protein
MNVAENVIIENSPSFALSDYTFRVAEALGINRLGGYIKVDFKEEDITHFSAEVDGTEDRVDLTVRLDNEITEDQVKVHIAHEMIHAVQILTGRLIHIGLTWCEESHGIVYKHIFDDKEYINVKYADQPWEIEAYSYEEEVYNAVESGSETLAEIQSAIHPRRP